jgi:hypothetical protein
MLNNISKNQNQQSPSEQGRAVQTKTNPSESTNTAAVSKLRQCAVKATLHHFGGETSEILMIMPEYTLWGEFLETANIAIREYVNQLTRHWIKITHFYTESGVLLPDGTIKTAMSPCRYDVPMDKVFSQAKRGEWLSPDQHPHHPRYNQRGSSLDLSALALIVSQRNEAVYSKLDDNTTLCGVPESSMHYYFYDGDIPSGTFEHEGATYVVVYSFVKTQEGGAPC